MTNRFHLLLSKTATISFLLIISFASLYAQKITIPITTNNKALILQTDDNNRLRTVYFGEPLVNSSEYATIASLSRVDEKACGIYNATYTTAGTWNLSEPAIQVVHSDGNNSLELKYISHKQEKLDDNISLTSIVLKDPIYPFQVTLFYKVWKKQNIIEQWTEISHKEKNAVSLKKYASANLHFTNKDFYLTSFHNRWAKEMQPSENKLTFGTKSFESILGTRALLLQSSNFILSFDKPASENDGNVMLCQLAWSGNFKYDFEIDSYNNLRLIAGINPYSSEYLLKANEVFKTPPFIYAISNHGTGEASRNLHSWARQNKILEGNGERLTLLNNWESTHFDFDEDKIVSLFKDAKSLGVDMFLLEKVKSICHFFTFSFSSIH